MDKKSKERLNNITSKAPETLTKEEIAFLRARSSYLTRTQAQDYESVLQTPKGTVKKDGKKEKSR